MAMNTNRVIELCLVFLISILSFSIGTFVGKKYSDNQHKLALLDPNLNKHEGAAGDHAETTAQAHDATEGVKPAATISDAEVAKMAEEFSSEEETEQAAQPVAAASPTASKESAAKKAEATEIAQHGKPLKEITADVADAKNVVREVANIGEKAKSIAADSTGSALYTVQVGSFPSPAEADKIVTSLQARGYKANHAEATVNGKTWYRVQVGLFNNLQDAQTHKKELVEQNHLSSAIIQRLSK